MEAADVFREALELGLRQFVTTGCSEKGWQCPLEDQATSDIRRDFLTLQGCSVHKLQFFFPSEAKEFGQTFKNPDISGRRIDASLDLAPVAGIETNLIAEVSKGQLFLNSEGFGKFVEHDGVMGCGRILPHDGCMSISLHPSDGCDPPTSQQPKPPKVFLPPHSPPCVLTRPTSHTAAMKVMTTWIPNTTMLIP